MTKEKTYAGKYYLQHYDSEYKPYYWTDDTPQMANGMNSCGSEIEPILDQHEIDLDFKSTYIVEYSVKIRKMSPGEYKKWVQTREKDETIDEINGN